MTIELKEGWYYGGMWFVGGGRAPSGDQFDWLACLYKEGPIDDHSLKWQMAMRFRYLRDEKIWDSEDEKSWYYGEREGSAPEAELLAAMDKMAEVVAESSGGKVDSRHVRGDYRELVEWMSGMPWAHVQMAELEPPTWDQVVKGGLT